MKPGWMAATMMATAAAAAARAGLCEAKLTVWLEGSQLADTVLLDRAEGTAVRIFDQLGVKLEWRIGAPKPVPCGEAVEILLDSSAPAGFAPTAMAYATVGTTGAAIHVFYNRVIEFHTRQLAPTLLGHVFAHEITHVLENVARHSDEGILKANWNSADFRQMEFHPLPFAPVDAELVRARFGLQ